MQRIMMLLVFSLGLVSSAAFADYAADSPNLYDCRSRDLQFTYIKGATDDASTLLLVFEGSTHKYQGSQIQTASTVLGTVVSVPVKTIPDKGVISASIVIPTIAVSSNGGL